MARKQVKRERGTQEVASDPVQATTTFLSQTRPLEPPSSGNTEVDHDVIMNLDQAVTDEHGEGQITRVDSTNAVVVDIGSSETLSSGTSQGLEVLGRGVKELVQAIQNLRHLGVEDLVLPLPKIVVVGDQSTGKSSLIEGISEIKVPRKAGVCTRCPLEINLIESSGGSDPWVCVVSLYKKYMYDGSHGKTVTPRVIPRTTATYKPEGATKKRPLGPWVLQDGENFFFAKTSNKDDVAHLLEWAQIATLNPKSSHHEYIPGTTDFKGNQDCQVKFSPNVVRLEISGPDLPNLSFYDLPGVINVSDVPEENYLVDLVKNLVRQYIKADNCINLLALPMTDDPANSSASRLIRDEAAEIRTVGVLTKPDRVQEAESLDQWVQILAGERFELGHGYHIVKNNPDSNVNHATARAQEKEFFTRNTPWSTVLREYSDRFGTLQLQTFLSQKLTAQIKDSLPHISRQVQQKLTQIEARLNELPKAPIGNLQLKIWERLTVFESEIRNHVDGGDSRYTLQKQWHGLARKFQQVLAESRPMLIQPALTSGLSVDSPGTPTPGRKYTRPSAGPIEIDSASDEEVPRSIPDRVGKKRYNEESSGETTMKRLRLSEIPQFKSSVSTEKKSYSKSFSLADVRNSLKDHYIALPGEIDPKATQSMIKLSIKVWKLPTEKFLDSTLALCQETVFGELHRAFAEWNNTLIHYEAERICGSFLDQVMVEQRQIVTRILEWEIYKPMAVIGEAITAATDKALTMLQTRRREYRASKYLEQQDSSGNQTPSRQNKADRLAKVTDAQLGTDPYSQEVLAISHVKGYYDYAFPRFVEHVCQSVACELFVKCRNALKGFLEQELGVTEPDSHERCALLLAANAEDERERRQLIKEQEKLQKASSWLKDLGETVEYDMEA